MRRNLPTVVLAWLLGLAAAVPSIAETARPPAPLLTQIQDIRALTSDEGARGHRVRIRGTVTHFDEIGRGLLFIHDGRFGQFVDIPERADLHDTWKALRRGDVVEIEGRTVRGGFAPNVRPEIVRVFGRGSLPEPKALPIGQLLTGRHDCDYVEIEGVVQRVWLATDPKMHTLFAEVAVDGGVVRGSFWNYEAADLQRFIDARVRLRGNAGTLFGQTGQLRGVSIFVGSTRDIEVLSAPPDPFSIPVRAIRSIYNYSSAGEVNRRIRVGGVVTSRMLGSPVQVSDFTASTTFRDVRHVIYLHDGESGARIETEQETRVEPGDVVEAAGFPAVTPGKPILHNAVFRVVGSAAPPPPITVLPSEVLTAEHDAELVRVEGQLLGILRSSTALRLVLKMGETVFDAPLDPSFGSQLADIRPGSTVSATGVYSYQWGPPPSFRLFLRSPDDVVVLSAGPWWTLRHTGVLLAIVALVGAAATVWARMLSNQKREQFQAILSERNRVARELHDTLEQGLAGITLQLEAVAGSLDASPAAARQSLDVARQMLRYSLEEARRSVMDLRSEALDSRDLAGALTSLARQMTVGTSPRVDVRVEGTVRRLGAAHEHHLLRIGLEALTNALRHASATRIDILLRFGGEAIELVVRDDGCGLGNGSHDMPGSHFGLQGIRERVDKLGGTVEIESRPGEGVRLSVVVPLHRRPRVVVRPVLGEIWPRS
jgi:signal transduction histidine kinase